MQRTTPVLYDYDYDYDYEIDLFGHIIKKTQ